ncbi:hypothetical protein ACEN9X_17420 [Mucilaginibacter sp. Mucisp86]|uniref:hypothetical protein n=1 Tax=Mucilaginibacter sp. Mucisp86 TaxID=3243060 RepID=UPI0039B3DF97
MRKKINIIILLITVAAFSCKKEHSKSDPGSPDNKAHTVTLTIDPSGFSQSIGNSNKLKVNSTVNPVDFRNYIDTLYINFNDKVYTFSTKNLTTINIPSQQLFPGTYKAFAMGGKKGLRFYVISVLDATYDGQWKDSFCANQSFTVANSDLTVSLNLQRVNAALEVIIQDSIPKNASYITLALSKEYHYYLPKVNLVDQNVIDNASWVNKYTIADNLKEKPNFTIDQIVLNTIAPFNLTIIAYDASNRPLATKVINNVKLAVNQKAIFTGTLFGGATSNNTGSNFPVQVDTSWNSVPILKPF